MKYIKIFEYSRFSQTLKKGDIFKLDVNKERIFIVEVIDVIKYKPPYEISSYSLDLNIILTYSFKRNRWRKFEDESSKISTLASFINDHGKPLTEKDLIEFGDLLDDYKMQKDANKYNL